MKIDGLTDRVLGRLLRPAIELLQRQSARLKGQEESLARLQATTSVLERHFANLKADVRELTQELSALARATDNVRHTVGPRGLGGQARRLEKDVRALLRRALLVPDALPFPQRLYAHRANISSQNEEDGILLALLAEAGVTNARFVDIGPGIGGGVAAMLAQECGWSGVMIDANQEHVKLAQPRFGQGRITVVHAFVTRENVNSLIEAHGFAGDIDLLSLDIDGNDYWVWQGLEVCSPRLVALEYNAFFGLERAVTLPYQPAFERSTLPALLRKNYFGASLPAFVRLGRRKGYRLVTTDGSGLNAFFVRNDVAPSIPECPIDELPHRVTDVGKYPDLIEQAARHGLHVEEVL